MDIVRYSKLKNHLQDCMCHLGYKHSNTDNDLWLRKSKDDSGNPYYEYILLYVDDCLAVSHRAEQNILEVGASTAQELEKQEEQLDNIDGKVIGIDDKINNAHKILDNISSYLKSLLGPIRYFNKMKTYNEPDDV